MYLRDLDHCPLDGAVIAEQDEDPNVGRTIGRYHIEAFVGAGAIGRVYRARHDELATTFAMKLLYGDYACDGDFAARFRREAVILGSLKHPGIIGVTDFGSNEEGTPFLVMEYGEGRTLAAYLAAAGALTESDAISIASQIASALAQAHEQGVVHRDLKPQNVLVSNQAVGRTAKILDFGFAQAVQSDDQPGITRSNTTFGTPAYMSPEQVNLRTLDHRSDLFSVGVVLWELLTSKRLFYRSSDYETVRSVMRCQSPFPQTVDSSLPWGVSWVTWRSLRKRPFFRYRTGRQMRAALIEGDDRDHQAARDAVADWVGQLFAKELAQREAALRRSMGDAARHRMIRDGGFELLEEVTDPDLRMRPPTIPTVGSRHRGGWWGTAMGLVGPWRWIVLMTAALVFLGISVGLYVAGSQKPEYGYLHVISDRQDARVTIGQTDVGLVPVRKVTVIPGRHRIQGVAGSQRRVLEVDISPGENRVVKVSFDAPK